MVASHITLEAELESDLRNRGADFVSYVDISQLAQKHSRQFPRAILFGMVLSPEFIQLISGSSETDEDEFHATEGKTDQLADYMADYLSQKGYSACSQSENNLLSTDQYNESTKTTSLPHKTIAGLAGLGWIGKHNLLVNPDFGSAISLCSVLTDAPLKTVLHAPVTPLCGDCNICRDICQLKAIKGNTWNSGTFRDEMLDVYLCNSCLKCLALCPWTQDYMNKAEHPSCK